MMFYIDIFLRKISEAPLFHGNLFKSYNPGSKSRLNFRRQPEV
jgi:hypothetical protein